MGHYSPRQAWYCGISRKPLKIATPLLDYKTNCKVSREEHFEKNQLDQIQNGRLSAFIHFHMADIW